MQNAAEGVKVYVRGSQHCFPFEGGVGQFDLAIRSLVARPILVQQLVDGGCLVNFFQGVIGPKNLLRNEPAIVDLIPLGEGAIDGNLQVVEESPEIV